MSSPRNQALSANQTRLLARVPDEWADMPPFVDNGVLAALKRRDLVEQNGVRWRRTEPG